MSFCAYINKQKLTYQAFICIQTYTVYVILKLKMKTINLQKRNNSFNNNKNIHYFYIL